MYKTNKKIKICQEDGKQIFECIVSPKEAWTVKEILERFSEI